MVLFNFNKKGDFYNEWFLALFALIVIVISFSLVINLSSTSKEITQTVPTLNYEFPNAYISTFINMELTNEEKIKIGFDTSKRYYVLDLIVEDSSLARSMIQVKRLTYINSMKLQLYDIVSFYNSFSGNNLQSSDLIQIRYDQDKLLNLNREIIDDNYFYFFETKKNTYTIIYFKKSKYDNSPQVQSISDLGVSP